MFNRTNITSISAIKTIARFWSALSIALILLFFFGEGIKIFELTLKEIAGLILFPVGLSLGFIIAWKREIFGSLISLISVILFTILMGASWFVFVLALPAVLFLLYGFISAEK